MAKPNSQRRLIFALSIALIGAFGLVVLSWWQIDTCGTHLLAATANVPAHASHPPLFLEGL
jgi:hypothetical protein